MPRLAHRHPKYRKHASGQAVVTLGGRDIYLGEHGTATSKREYGRLIGEWSANNRTAPARARIEDYSIAELIASYWTYAQEYYAVEDGKSGGELGSIKLALRVLKDRYADADVSDFGPLALRAVRDAMIKLKWSRKYVNGQVNRLRRLFGWGVERELVPANIWLSLKAVAALKAGKSDARENEPVTTVDDAHVDAVLPFLNSRLAAIVKLQRIVGTRPSELLPMRGAEISKANPALWEYRPMSHKTKYRGHDRVIYLNKAAQKILKPFLKSDANAYIFRPIDAEEERRKAVSEARKTPMSCGNRPGSNRVRKPRRAPGEHYTITSYYQAIVRACDVADRWAKAGRVIMNDVRLVPRWHPYQIRHSTATKLRAEHGLEAAQVILGHKTLTATQIYAERNVEKAKQIMMSRY